SRLDDPNGQAYKRSTESRERLAARVRHERRRPARTRVASITLPHEGATMSKKRVKQYLMLLTVIGLVSIASGSGTFATFSAETTNAGNTFSTGTIVLSNTVNAGVACLSSAGGVDVNINAACAAV